MTKREMGFLNEVAAELVSLGIEAPTTEQIAEAMQSRIAREWDIFSKLYTNGLYARHESAREVLDALAASVYQAVRA